MAAAYWCAFGALALGLHWHCRFRACGGVYAYRPGTILFLKPLIIVSDGFFVAITSVWLFCEACAVVLHCLASAPPPCGQAALEVFAYFVHKAFRTFGDVVAGLGQGGRATHRLHENSLCE